MRDVNVLPVPMNLDLEIIEGRPEKPVIVLVHGLGMNRHFWSRPEKCQALGGTSDLSVFFSGKPGEDGNAHFSTGTYFRDSIRGLKDRLVEAGFTTASWSQRRPVGPVRAAIDELTFVVELIRDGRTNRPLFFVGHSRGGLIARHYLGESPARDLRGLITIGTPHGGSQMADLAKFFTPAAAFLKKLLPEDLHGDLASALRRTTDFFTGPAIDELKPGSDFLQALPPPPAGLPRLAFAGARPHFFDLYFRVSAGDSWQSVGFPDLLTKVWPDRLLPDEIKNGLGDGLVTTTSASPQATETITVNANHVTLAFDPKVHDRIVDFLKHVTASVRADSSEDPHQGRESK